MKRTLTPLLVMLACVLLHCDSAFAQSWQWGKRGGGNSNGLNATPEDNVIDMSTDKNGNVYVLSVLETSSSEDVNGQLFNGFGAKDMLLSSFNCTGGFRWKKIIGSPSTDVLSTQRFGVKTDSLGHVYVAGYVFSSTGTKGLDTDTILPSGYAKTMFLAQYDTSGVYNWLRMPQPDTMQSIYSSRYGTIDMNVDNAGNVYWLCIMNQCALAGSSLTIPAQGVYILKYDLSGNLTNVTPVQMQATYQSQFTGRMARDKNSGQFYVAGQYSAGILTIGSQSITKPMYVAAFDASGNFLWKHENNINSPNCGFFARPVIDAAGGVYLSGTSSTGDIFNGSTLTNTLGTTNTRFPIVVKLDASGNNLWMKNASANGNTNCDGIALRGNGEVAIAGSYPGKLLFPGVDSLNHILNQSYDVFLARFNTQTGALVGLDSIASPFGYRDMASAMTSDTKGNIYVGGLFSAQITVNTNVINTSGGDTDFFIAKYGSANCTCTTPLSNYNFNAPANSAVVAFTYNGTPLYDSLRWDFGDGGTGTTATPTHTYATTGTYNVCVTVYNACGSDTKCQTVSVTVGIEEVQLGEITIYPNPVSNKLTINGANGATAELYNVMGSKVYSGKLSTDNADINTATLPAGSYILQLTTAEGHRKTLKLAKE